MAPPDQALPDQALPDQGPPPPPCSANAIERPVTGAWNGMALCESKTATPQQWAAAACNSNGWHLCTASEYLALGGKNKMLTSQAVIYWIAGCVEPGKPPMDGVCGSWGTGCPTACAVGWGCTGPPGISRTGYDRYTLNAHMYCYKVGVDDLAYGAYWFVLVPTGSPSTTGAVCCPN